jgi:hypothetical protein
MGKIEETWEAVMDRVRDKMAIPVSGRLTPARYRTLQGWCCGAYRKRSEVVSMVLDRVLEILEQGGAPQPVESFVQRLRADPPV